MEELVINSATEAAEILQGIEKILANESGVYANQAEVWPLIVSISAIRQWVDEMM